MNELINPAVVGALRRILTAASPGTGWAQLAGAGKGLDELSLRERTDLVSRALLADLPQDYPTAAGTFRHAPDLVVATATAWMAAPDDNTPWVVRHGLRTLLKKAHPGALELLGFPPASLAVTPPRLDRPDVELPGEMRFEFEITNKGPAEARLAVDYAVHYAKANGTLAVKVFKLGTPVLAPGDTRTFAKRHAFRQMTTRVHYPGAHILELQVNGVRYAPTGFVVHTSTATTPHGDLTDPQI